MAPDLAHRLEKLASGQGDGRDMYLVGMAYLTGGEVDQDVGQALAWLERAVELDEPFALARLAVMYETGEPVPQDCERARAYYGRLERSDCCIGPYWVALAHYFGSDCMPRDEDLAFRYFAQAAKAGHLVSEARLGVLMRSGRFGLGNRAMGYLLPIGTLWKALPLILSDRDDCAFWDAGRWLPSAGALGSLRQGTRFE